MAEPTRLNKYLAHTTGISRRQADEHISAGIVLVNGVVARLGAIIQPGRDVITVRDENITHTKKRYTYVVFNKPIGYVCSRRKQGEAPTIYDLLPREFRNLKVAGRLDKDSCGLVLLTDDGDTIFKLTHPKFAKQKVYIVGLNKPLKTVDKKMIHDGVELDDGNSSLQISNITRRTTGAAKPNTYRVTMYEGRNRQIRRTFKALGYTVTHLERIKLGPYTLQDLAGKRMLHITK